MSSCGRKRIGRAKPTWRRATQSHPRARREGADPPAVWYQGRGDTMRDYKEVDTSFARNEPQRFVVNYRKARGEITLKYIETDPPRRPHAGFIEDGECSSAWWRLLEQRSKAVAATASKELFYGLGSLCSIIAVRLSRSLISNGKPSRAKSCEVMFTSIRREIVPLLSCAERFASRKTKASESKLAPSP